MEFIDVLYVVVIVVCCCVNVCDFCIVGLWYNGYELGYGVVVYFKCYWWSDCGD